MSAGLVERVCMWGESRHTGGGLVMTCACVCCMTGVGLCLVVQVRVEVPVTKEVLVEVEKQVNAMRHAIGTNGLAHKRSRVCVWEGN